MKKIFKIDEVYGTLISEEELQNRKIRDDETTIPPPVSMEGFHRKYNFKTKKWSYHPDIAYRIDLNGFLKEPVFMPIPLFEIDESIVENPPPDNFMMPRWDGGKWEDKPICEGIFRPFFDLDKNKWEEGASSADINSIIDAETDKLIKQWCREQNKNEEYYINRGIEYGKNDDKYQQYCIEKEKIKETQKLKKLNNVWIE